MGNFEKNLEQMSALKKTKNAVMRLENVEKRLLDVEDAFPRTISAVNEVMKNVDGGMKELFEMVEAVVDIMGPEKVASKVVEHRKKKTETSIQNQKDALEKALADGLIKEIESVTDISYVVGFETDGSGNPVAGGGYLQLPFPKYKEEVRAQILGKSKGFTIPTPNGGSFELLGVYELTDTAAEQAELNKDLETADQEVVQSNQG